MTENSAAPTSAGPASLSGHQLIDAARCSANWTVDQLWLQYIALGGDLEDFDIDAYLAGLMPISPAQHDVMACALNERLADLPHPSRVPYRVALPAWLSDMATTDGRPSPTP